MREKYVRFNVIAMFVLIKDDTYYEFKPAFVLNCSKYFILHKHPQSTKKLLIITKWLMIIFRNPILKVVRINKLCINMLKAQWQKSSFTLSDSYGCFYLRLTTSHSRFRSRAIVGNNNFYHELFYEISDLKGSILITPLLQYLKDRISWRQNCRPNFCAACSHTVSGCLFSVRNLRRNDWYKGARLIVNAGQSFYLL